MHERNAEQKNSYFREVARNIQKGGLTVLPEKDGLLPASHLFTKEQLAVIFDAAQNMTVLGLVSNPEQEKLLEQVMKQAEIAVPEVIGLANELTQSPKQSDQGMQIY